MTIFLGNISFGGRGILVPFEGPDLSGTESEHNTKSTKKSWHNNGISGRLWIFYSLSPTLLRPGLCCSGQFRCNGAWNEASGKIRYSASAFPTEKSVTIDACCVLKGGVYALKFSSDVASTIIKSGCILAACHRLIGRGSSRNRFWQKFLHNLSPHFVILLVLLTHQ